MRSLVLAAALFAGLHVTPAFSQSVSLRVSPVLVDLSAPTAASSVRISNDAKRPISVQVRIFKWSQSNGVDTYTPATDVAVSPPISQLKPGGENMVRVVRTSKRPVKAEESYRLIVDELPSASRKNPGPLPSLSGIPFRYFSRRQKIQGPQLPGAHSQSQAAIR